MTEGHQRLRVVMRDVSKAFGGTEALRHVSLAVEEASVVAVIGQNGAGKSTLLNVLSGNIRPDSGAVVVNHLNVRGAPEAVARSGVFRTFQRTRLVSRRSVLDNVVLASRAPHMFGLVDAFKRGYSAAEGLARQRALAALVQVGMQDHANARADELSFGQQKLTAIAMALASPATVLLLDEPLAGVDRAGVKCVLTAIKDAARNGRTILVVEHELENVIAAADRAVVMVQGRVARILAPSDVNADELLRAYEA